MDDPVAVKTGAWPEGSVGVLSEPVNASYPPEQSVGQTIEALRERVKSAFITYVYVVDAAGRLLGIVTMRDLLFSEHGKRLDEVMLRDVFSLPAAMPLEEGMRRVLDRHYPVYPVVDGAGRLVGLLRGQAMFEARAIDISAQPGSMVGV